GRNEGTAPIAVEYQPTGRSHQTASQNTAPDFRYLPGGLSRLDIDRLQRFGILAGGTARTTAVERLARFPPQIVLAIDVAGFIGEHIEESRGRAVRVGRP